MLAFESLKTSGKLSHVSSIPSTRNCSLKALPEKPQGSSKRLPSTTRSAHKPAGNKSARRPSKTRPPHTPASNRPELPSTTRPPHKTASSKPVQPPSTTGPPHKPDRPPPTSEPLHEPASTKPAHPPSSDPATASSKPARRYYDGRPSERLSDVPKEQLRSLIDSNVSQKNGLKLGRRCVTPKVAQDILTRFNTRDVLKIEAAHKNASRDIRVTRAELERTTGGIVIWNQGSKILLYRGPEAVKMREARKKEPLPQIDLKSDSEDEDEA